MLADGSHLAMRRLRPDISSVQIAFEYRLDIVSERPVFLFGASSSGGQKIQIDAHRNGSFHNEPLRLKRKCIAKRIHWLL